MAHMNAVDSSNSINSSTTPRRKRARRSASGNAEKATRKLTAAKVAGTRGSTQSLAALCSQFMPANQVSRFIGELERHISTKVFSTNSSGRTLQ